MFVIMLHTSFVSPNAVTTSLAPSAGAKLKPEHEVKMAP